MLLTAEKWKVFYRPEIFGSKGKEQFAVMKKKIGDKPLMCMEFWVGWFDNWGVETHQTGDLEEHAKDLDEILSEGHVNIYMFEGGTNLVLRMDPITMMS